MVRCKGCRKYVEQLKIHKYNVCSTECLGIVKRNSAPAFAGRYESKTVKQQGKHVPVLVEKSKQTLKKEAEASKTPSFKSSYVLKKGKYVEIFK